MAQGSASNVHRLLVQNGSPNSPVKLGNVRYTLGNRDQTLILTLNGKPRCLGELAPHKLRGGETIYCAHFIVDFFFQFCSERTAQVLEDRLFRVATMTKTILCKFKVFECRELALAANRVCRSDNLQNDKPSHLPVIIMQSLVRYQGSHFKEQFGV